ncbi:hypothetical protein HDE_09487 [Halotydeus destructor]|nr:hypothetical protein HDE_09487 [Halotydeus destructor]
MLALSLLRLTTGLFAGKSLSVNMVAIPSVRYANYELSAFRRLNQQASRLGMLFMAIMVPLTFYYWWSTSDRLALMCGLLLASLTPQQFLTMVPAVGRLINLSEQKDKDKIKKEIEFWNRSHWFHTLVGIFCYAIFEFCLYGKD